MWIDTSILFLALVGQFVVLLILAAWVGEIHTRVKRIDEATQSTDTEPVSSDTDAG